MTNFLLLFTTKKWSNNILLPAASNPNDPPKVPYYFEDLSILKYLCLTRLVGHWYGLLNKLNLHKDSIN